MEQTLDQSRPNPEAATTQASYRPGVKADFDRLYRATYQRTFATLMLILRNPVQRLPDLAIAKATSEPSTRH
jgi:hypothetical protein